GCAVCSGSRTALLTGTHYQRLSMNAVLFPHSTAGLHPDEVTIADLLREQGYRTSCVGKWHLGHLPPCLPTDQGFESYYGVPYSNDMWIDPANQLADDLLLGEGLTREQVEAGHKKRNWVPLMRDEEVTEYPTDQKTLTKRYTEEAISFIKEHQEEPFFLYLPHTMVHLPLAVSEEFDGRTGKLIWDAIEEVDWSVGQLLQTLREEGLEEETLVVFTSDNGAAVGSSLPLRAKKASVYDGGIREPTVMWWPGQIPAGTVCREVAATIDLLPTIAHLVGSPLPEQRIDGKNIWPLMAGEVDAKSPHEYYVLMHGAGAVRSGKWKFYPWSEAKGKDRGAKISGRTPSDFPVQLYDTVTDQGEMTNLAETQPKLVEELTAVWEAHVADIKSSLRPTAEMKRPEGALSPERPKKERTTALFEGLNLSRNWTMDDPEAWVIENDMILTCQMKEEEKNGETRQVGRGYLWTKREYGDFELTLDYKLSEGANSGVFYRTDPKDPVQGGFEIQLMDNEGFQRMKGRELEAKKLNGSFYDGKGPSADPSHPVGEWNHFQLTCQGPKIRVAINGVEVVAVNVDEWKTPGQNPDGSKNKFKTALKDLPRKGHIGLQNHGQKVWFREIAVTTR
ncbi:MAG: sulfatase-like hydrolase/transferase, partial [Verrucomicrobiota bacterium]